MYLLQSLFKEQWITLEPNMLLILGKRVKNKIYKNIMVEKKLKKPDKTTDVMHLVNKKVDFFKDVIQKTILHIQQNKMYI